MSIIHQLIIGFRTYPKAIELILTKGLWWAFLIPIFLNLLLFIGGFAFVHSLTGYIENWILDLVGLNSNIFFLSDVLRGFLSGMVWIILKVLFFFLFAYYGGYITLILLSPLLAYLSERTEEIITGKKYPFNLEQWIQDVVRGILIALRNMFIEMGWIVLMFIVSFIPLIGWLGAFVLFLISAYFYGFSFIDYTNERKKMKIRESIQFVRNHKWLSVANGSIFTIFLLIPFYGILLAGFTAIIAAIAATLAVHEINPTQQESITFVDDDK